MNVAARHRRQNGAIMRSFCNQFVGKSKFVELIRKFKYKVIIMQRFIRAAHQITQSQITAVFKVLVHTRIESSSGHGKSREETRTRKDTRQTKTAKSTPEKINSNRTENCKPPWKPMPILEPI